jgi:acyl-CoA thioester hydrolase
MITIQTYPEKDVFIKIPLYVNTYDIDIAGHVNNIVYVKWLEKLRNELFSELCPLEILISKNIYPVIVGCEMKYKKQIGLFDKPIGRMCLFKHSHGMLLLKAEIEVELKPVFSAMQKCVLLYLDSNTIYKGEISALTR